MGKMLARTLHPSPLRGGVGGGGLQGRLPLWYPTPNPFPQGGEENRAPRAVDGLFRFPEFALAFRRKSPAQCRHPVPHEGTSAVVTDVGAGRGGRRLRVTMCRRAYGEIVWS